MRVPILVLCAASVGCGRGTPAERGGATTAAGPAVARVAGRTITADEVRAAAVASGKTPRAALDDLIAHQLLVAATGPIDDLPVRQAMVGRLLERDFEARTRIEDVPEAELRAAYERAKAVFVHSRLVEISLLAVYTGERMKPAARERSRATARELAAYIAGRPARTPEDFQEIARDPAWAGRGVRFWRGWQSDTQPFSPALGREVMKMTRRGDTTPLVEDDTGLYLARYMAERPPENRTYAEVREELLRGYHPRWRQRRFHEFARQLTDAHDVEVRPDRLTPGRQGRPHEP